MTEAPKDAREVNPSVPPALAALTAELLRKNPAERPPGMHAVAERLAAFVGGLTTVPDAPVRSPVPAQPPTKSKTTFGDSAAELVEGAAAPKRGGVSMTLVVAALLGLGAGGVAVSRLHGHSSDLAPAPPAAAFASPPVLPPTAAPAPAPAAVPTPSPPSAPPAPAAASPSASVPAAAATPPASAKETASAKKKGHHHAVEVASNAEASPAGAPGPAPAAATSEAPAATDFSGIWEGPWIDNERHQNGRLYLQVGSGGTANGWLSNTTAGRSYRLAGRADRPGEYALVCECPVNQGFNVRVVLHQAEGSELKGRLSLAAAAGVFGQSHVVLHRSAAR